MIKNKIPDKCYDCDEAVVKVRTDDHYTNGKREAGHDVTIEVDCRDNCEKEDNEKANGRTDIS